MFSPKRGLPYPGLSPALDPSPKEARILVCGHSQVCSQLAPGGGAPPPSPPAPLPLTSGGHLRARTAPEWTCLRPGDYLDAPDCGPQRSAGAAFCAQTPLFFSRLCPWPPSLQPAHRPRASLLAWLLTSPCPSPSWSSADSNAGPYPGTVVGRLCPPRPAQPASQPGCLPPATCLSPLPLLPTPPDLPRVRPSNNLSSLLLPLLIPLFLALQSLGVGLSLSHALSAPPSPRSSSPISPPPASTPSPAHSPSPSPAAPPSSPTSLFQLRAGSSGQFPHRSASGEETAPPR